MYTTSPTISRLGGVLPTLLLHTSVRADPRRRRQRLRRRLQSHRRNLPTAPDEIQEDDESVRCICGHDEYPGPPPFDEDSKQGVKDAIDHERIFAIEITDELAGFFCACRKDLHKIYTASNGLFHANSQSASQKYSIFLPIHRPSQTASRATSASKEDVRSPKGGNTKASRASAAASHSSKRRSTMNSRDAAYDEEEQLRRAIEASKEDTIPEEGDLASRRPKRGREESEEKIENVKRQRTNSKSPTPAPEKPTTNVLDESDEELALRNGHSKKSRNAVRSQRERAEREERREEQERKRAEAASKRKGRAERRRADDSDPSDELPLATRTLVNRTAEAAQPPDPPAPSQLPPDTPPIPQAQTNASKKKYTQSKRKGRNQYTKDRDNDHEASPARSISRDVSRNADEGGANTKSTSHEATGKQSKGRGGMSSKITMSDMKRRANGILEFITRKQVELVNDPLSDSSSSPSQGGTEDCPTPTTTQINGDSSNKKPRSEIPISNAVGSTEPIDTAAVFKDMSCVEMMDSLTRDLMKWQQEFIH
ncbi:hypothetical protein NUW58_g7136 [Xylaria curta]|uniref:Uncharacterized protein n=1 Tax=Xylaria curta TaxID=42375 RepID=A0ACC1NK55_9PEZI|nr:hypothetical protein NUW58_g7136 [Xylaria curta]